MQNFPAKSCLFPARALPFHNNPPVTSQYSLATPILNENSAKIVIIVEHKFVQLIHKRAALKVTSYVLHHFYQTFVTSCFQRTTFSCHIRSMSKMTFALILRHVVKWLPLKSCLNTLPRQQAKCSYSFLCSHYLYHIVQYCWISRNCQID